MSQLRIAVVGAGHLGKIHAKLAATQPNACLSAIVDPCPNVRKLMNETHQCDTFAKVEELPLDSIDAAIIATPTVTHFDVAKYLLENKKHVLIEKPMTFSPEEGYQLQQIAKDCGCTIQVGHVERFNPTYRAVKEKIENPRYLELTRTSPFTGRSTDIGVIFDLMIHDIDLMMDLVGSEVADVQAIGMSVFGDNEDMAQARITFENGAVANLSASRCSYQPQRNLQVYGSNGFVSADLTTRQMENVTVPGDIQSKRVLFNSLSPEAKAKITEELFTNVLPKCSTEAEPANAILDEQADWIDAIDSGCQHQVPASDGIRNVEIAKRILKCVRQHNWTEDRFGPRGPLVSIDQLNSKPEELKRAA